MVSHPKLPAHTRAEVTKWMEKLGVGILGFLIGDTAIVGIKD